MIYIILPLLVILLIILSIRSINYNKNLKEIILRSVKLEEVLTAEQILQILNNEGYNPIIYHVISLLAILEKEKFFECFCKQEQSYYESGRILMVHTKIYYRRIG